VVIEHGADVTAQNKDGSTVRLYYIWLRLNLIVFRRRHSNIPEVARKLARAILSNPAALHRYITH
jgi:hypothetical protein